MTETVDSINSEELEREEQRAQANREELILRVAQLLPEDGFAEPLDGLLLSRVSTPTAIGHGVSIPAFCLIAQGRKEMLLGDKLFWYDAAHYLIATSALPVASQITEASKERPYLSLNLKLDATLVGSVMVEVGYGAPQEQSLVSAIGVSPLDAGLLDAAVRLVRLLDSPDDAPFLASLLKREIVYRLLKGEQRARLGHVATLGSNTQRIAAAIERFRKAYNQPLRIEDIANELGMSVSGFHHHFKAHTAMSPLQFQKQLRLLEARRLMLGEGLDAASVGNRVGYEDSAYFSREYKKLFGEPPMRDAERLRKDVEGRASERRM